MIASSRVTRAVSLTAEQADGLPVTIGPFAVSTPDVGTALVVMETAPLVDTPEGWAAFAAAVRQWWPSGLWSVMVGGPASAPPEGSRREAAALASSHLSVGAVDRNVYRTAFEAALSRARRAAGESPAPEAAGEDDVARAKTAGWGRVVAEYRLMFGLSLADVLAEPWPAFLEQMEHSAVIHAREQVRITQAVAASRSMDAFNTLAKRAEMQAPEAAGDNEAEDTPMDGWEQVMRLYERTRLDPNA